MKHRGNKTHCIQCGRKRTKGRCPGLIGGLAIMIKSFIIVSFLLLATVSHAANVQLSWNANSANEQGFIIESSSGITQVFKEIARVTKGVTSTTANINVLNTLYCFRIVSYNQAGNALPSNTKCVVLADIN